MQRRLPRAAAIAAGLLLVVAPPAAFALKVLSAGWVLIVAFFVSPVLALGFLLQVAIAITGFLAPRGLFLTRGRWRPVLAGIVSSLGILAVGFFLLDFDDTGAGYSVFSDLAVGHGAITSDGGTPERVLAVEDLSNVLAAFGAVLWIGGWVWLVVEWAFALGRRSRARRAPRATGEVRIIEPEHPHLPDAASGGSDSTQA